MTYNLEAVVPIELRVPTTRILGNDPSTNEKNQSTALELMDEQCDKAELHNNAYKHAMKIDMCTHNPYIVLCLKIPRTPKI